LICIVVIKYAKFQSLEIFIKQQSLYDPHKQENENTNAAGILK